MKAFYTVKEVSEILGVSPYKVRKLIHEGQLKASRGPRRAFYIHATNLVDCVIFRKREYLDKLLASEVGPWARFLIQQMVVAMKASELIKRIKERKQNKQLSDTEGA